MSDSHLSLVPPIMPSPESGSPEKSANVVSIVPEIAAPEFPTKHGTDHESRRALIHLVTQEPELVSPEETTANVIEMPQPKQKNYESLLPVPAPKRPVEDAPEPSLPIYPGSDFKAVLENARLRSSYENSRIQDQIDDLPDYGKKRTANAVSASRERGRRAQELMSQTPSDKLQFPSDVQHSAEGPTRAEQLPELPGLALSKVKSDVVEPAEQSPASAPRIRLYDGVYPELYGVSSDEVAQHLARGDRGERRAASLHTPYDHYMGGAPEIEMYPQPKQSRMRRIGNRVLQAAAVIGLVSGGAAVVNESNTVDKASIGSDMITADAGASQDSETSSAGANGFYDRATNSWVMAPGADGGKSTSSRELSLDLAGSSGQNTSGNEQEATIVPAKQAKPLWGVLVDSGHFSEDQAMPAIRAAVEGLRQQAEIAGTQAPARIVEQDGLEFAEVRGEDGKFTRDPSVVNPLLMHRILGPGSQ